MGSHKTIRGSYFVKPTFQPPPPTPDYIVTGIIVPDATGDYFLSGQLNGKNYYALNSSFFLYWQPIAGSWILSSVLGSHAGFYWSKLSDPVEGNYTPGGTAVGTAIVSAGGI